MFLLLFTIGYRSPGHRFLTANPGADRTRMTFASYKERSIRTIAQSLTSLSLPHLGTGRLRSGVSFVRARLGRRRVQRRLLHIGLVGLSLALIGLVSCLIMLNPSRASGGAIAPALNASTDLVERPVDSLASVHIAVAAAQATGLPETDDVINQADSATIQQAVASANGMVVTKPQAVNSSYVSNRDIHSYVVQSGDTATALAAKFGVSSDSILWSNGLTGDTLPVGKSLLIPPVNGIAYTVQAGDTVAKLATKYQAVEDKITAYNDAELNGLYTGERVIIPDGKIVAPKPIYSYGSIITGFAWGTDAIYGHNGYAYGNCTWYVASQIDVPANWGNAATWAAGARAAGWHVGSTPVVGAIAQNSWMAGGLGHVAIVDGVSDDGSQVLIRDMNGIAGFARVGTAWQSANLFTNYITR